MDHEPNSLSDEWATPLPALDAAPPRVLPTRRLGLYAGQVVIRADFDDDLGAWFDLVVGDEGQDEA